MQDVEQLFDLQLDRELQMNSIGIKDLKRQTSDAENRAYASHTIYGSMTRREYTLKISAELRSRYNELKRGKAGQGRDALFQLKAHLDWDRIAYIALSTMLDFAGIPHRYGRLNSKDRKERELITVSEMNFLLAKRIMIEANLQYLRKNFRFKYKEMKEKFFTDHASFSQRITNIKRKVKDLQEHFALVASGERHQLNLLPETAEQLAQKFKWVNWTPTVQVQVGSLVARVVNDITGFFGEAHSFDEKGRQRPLFVFSKLFDEIREDLMKQSEGYAFFMIPMLIPPKPWAKDRLGGYHFSARAFYTDIVRGFRRGTEISDLTYEFINNQQNVGFCIDKQVLEVQRYLAEKGWSVLAENEDDEECKDAFRPYKPLEDHEIPKLEPRLQGVKKPGKDASEGERSLYNEKKAAMQRITYFHTRQQELQQLGRPVRRFFRLIKHIENDPCFFFPWSLDWRGRCYPMVDALNPQGPEYQKAVLNFADPTPVDDRTEFWLLVGIAGAAGQDKESFESRVAWCHANKKLITAVGKDPMGRGFKIWSSMPEPWIFLRACIEYHRIYEEGQDYTDIACLGMDATQSGLQLLGGMVLCKQTCDLVNCVPGHDKPQDAYGAVLAEAIRLMQEEGSTFPIHLIKGKRKLVKTPVMTKVYAAGHGTRLSQIRRALNKEKIRLAQSNERNEELIEYFTTKVEQAMINTIPGVDLILEWFQTVVAKAFERGVDDIKYKTPSGNVVTVEYREPLTKRVQTESLGQKNCKPVNVKNETRVNAIVGKGKTNTDDVLRAIAANFTHGAGDAALLHLGFHDADGCTFVTTHDCVYSPPSKQVDDNHRRVREAYVKVCQSGALETFAEMNRCSDIKPPIVETYDPETVRQARYFFC